MNYAGFLNMFISEYSGLNNKRLKKINSIDILNSMYCLK